MVSSVRPGPRGAPRGALSCRPRTSARIASASTVVAGVKSSSTGNHSSGRLIVSLAIVLAVLATACGGDTPKAATSTPRPSLPVAATSQPTIAPTIPPAVATQPPAPPQPTATRPAPTTAPPTAAPPQSSGCPQGCTTQTATCNIKGNISSSGEKIYHVPGGASYNQTQIDPSAGERWFCTGQEAVNNGWRAAQN